MMRCPAEPTIRDLLSDPLIRSVMKADRVDPGALEGLLYSLAPRVRRVRQSPALNAMPPASALAPHASGCAW